jgi:hypothetical protein
MQTRSGIWTTSTFRALIHEPTEARGGLPTDGPGPRLAVDVADTDPGDLPNAGSSAGRKDDHFTGPLPLRGGSTANGMAS